MKRYVSIAVKILAGIAIPASLAITYGDQLFNVPSAVVVFVPAIVAAVCLRLGTGQHWARTFLVLGVPLGLLSTSTSMVQIVAVGMLNDIPAIDKITLTGLSMAVALTALLYGGLVSAIGFAAVDKQEVAPRQGGSALWWLTPPVIAFLLMAWEVTSYDGRLDVFLDVSVLLVTLASIATFMSFRRETSPIKRWTEAALFSSIICVGIGVLQWFNTTNYQSGEIDTGAITFGLLGVTYGCVLYIGGYFYSFRNGQSDSIDAPRMNWHFLEVNAFLYFLTVAPTSLPESLSKIETSKQVATQQKELSERITALEAEIKRLSRE